MAAKRCRVERGAAHEQAVDARLTQQRLRDGGVDAAAVDDPGLAGPEAAPLEPGVDAPVDDRR